MSQLIHDGVIFWNPEELEDINEPSSPLEARPDIASDRIEEGGNDQEFHGSEVTLAESILFSGPREEKEARTIVADEADLERLKMDDGPNGRSSEEEAVELMLGL